jgi:hypothetical protein
MTEKYSEEYISNKVWQHGLLPILCVCINVARRPACDVAEQLLWLNVSRGVARTLLLWWPARANLMGWHFTVKV